MHWITIGVIFILSQPSTRHKASPQTGLLGSINIVALATPLPKDPSHLNPYIRYWEAAQYDIAAVRHARNQQDIVRRKKRDANIDSKSSNIATANSLKLNFFAHDKQFNVVLREDPFSVFSSDVQIENTEGPLQYDITRVYSGTLEDDENAFVHGVLTSENLFDGTITTNLEQYYIEPSSKYSENLHNAGIHSIVYKISDIQHPATNPDLMNGNSSGGNGKDPANHCASEKLRKKLKTEYKKRRKRNGNNFDEYENRVKKTRHKRWLPDELAENHNPMAPLDLDVPYNDDFTVLSETAANSKPNQNVNRKNILFSDYNPNSDFNLRNTNTNKNIIVNNFDVQNNIDNSRANLSRPSHKTHVEIITKNGATKKPNIIVNNYNPDVILTSTNFHHNNNINNNMHGHIRNDISDSFQRTTYDRKITCMLYLQADHTFSHKMGSDEASIEAITRHVQRANVIYKNTDFNGDGKPDNITFMIKRIKVHNMNALKDPTYRFPGNYGVEKFLELFSEEDYDAFCLAYMFTYRDFEMGTLGLAWTGDLKNAGGVCEKNGHYRGSLKSLNTGIVTLLNYGKHVPPAVSHVTLAHEIGHNFGSPHDPEQCTPGGEDGNYIMFARATSGDKRNNNKFSPCSLKAIEPVLNAKARSAKGCFTEPQQAICGNGVVDPGEQCDCGWEEDCKDTCCFPMSRHPKLHEKPCTLTPRASCSPSQGPCCTTMCELRFGDKCRDDNGCRDPSFCDGRMPQCPPSINKPNKTICNKEFVCYMGECTGSICLAYGLESCQCIPGPNDPNTKACELCCKLPGEENQCKSSFEWNDVPYDVPDVFAKPGTPCNDYNGYCDVFQKCREVDPSGPLATLRKLLLSEESIATFKKWIQTNWYTVVLIVVAVIILLVLSTKLLGKGTNKKKKHVTIIHSATTETVRLPEDNNGVIVHTAIRTKVPFKKKVQGKRQESKIQKPPTGGSNGTTAISSDPNQSSNVFKRPKTDSPKKNTKKKKRVSAPVVDEEQNKTPGEPAPIKTKKQKKANAKHKEIIDYSNRPENHSNTFGKVQKWLLESPIVTHPFTTTSNGGSGGGGGTGGAGVEHESKIAKIMKKSQSTPERLALRSPKKIKSVGNLNDKVKLQVVYKPPFKFSLKLSKNNVAVKTKVIGNKVAGRNKRKQQHSENKIGGESLAGPKTRRTAFLIRSTTEIPSNNGTPLFLADQPSDLIENKLVKAAEEPNYETLNPKKDEEHLYENVTMAAHKIEPVNTATFKISKSPSNGSNIIKTHSLCKTRKLSKDFMPLGPESIRGSTTNLNTQLCGSSQNLIRSSTTNLSKNRDSYEIKRGNYDLNRSSTTNLSKDKRHVNLKHRRSNSNLNLDDAPVSRSRKNSSTSIKPIDASVCQIMPKTNIPRVPSNSNLKVPSLRRGSISNIPRASLNAGSFTPQNAMFNGQPGNKLPSGNRSAGVPLLTAPVGHLSLDHNIPVRPHTADCNDIKRFEWPHNLPIRNNMSKDEPLPSDLEVMVSDVENMINDV